MLPHMGKRLLEGGLHLVSRGTRNDLRSHIVQMLFEFLDLASLASFEGMRDDLCQITVRRHSRFTRGGFKLGCVVFGEINGDAHSLSPISETGMGSTSASRYSSTDMPEVVAWASRLA
jgi:hypothetical protein